MKKIIVCSIAASLLCAATYLPWLWPRQQLDVWMLNIGQGDAIYIRTPQGRDILIDGGPDRSVINQLGQVMPPFDHTIELLIVTHADQDHIGGIPELRDSYQVETVLVDGSREDIPTQNALYDWAAADHATIRTATAGDRIDIEPGVWLDIIHPTAGLVEAERNDRSITALLHYNDTTMLLTGDIGEDIEQRLVEQYGDALRADVYKVAHHGSKNNADVDFLQAVQPQYALISVGANNQFGHPHAATLLRLEQLGATILRTDQAGSIHCWSDGTVYTCS